MRSPRGSSSSSSSVTRSKLVAVPPGVKVPGRGAAMAEAKPELEGDRPEQDRNQERGPAEQGEERGTPPLQDRALVCRERHCREHGERDDGDGADLVADA